MSRFQTRLRRLRNREMVRSVSGTSKAQAIRAMYDWIKALHVIAVISWMAGMLYLPRLFVYHCEAERLAAVGDLQGHGTAAAESDHQSGDDRDLARWLWLVWSGGWYRAGWFHAKFVLVLLMSAIHGLYARYVREFAEDRNTRSPKILSNYQ